jgi:hypothetical protein
MRLSAHYETDRKALEKPPQKDSFLLVTERTEKVASSQVYPLRNFASLGQEYGSLVMCGMEIG